MDDEFAWTHGGGGPCSKDCGCQDCLSCEGCDECEPTGGDS